MSNLAEEACEVCRAGAPLTTEPEVAQYLLSLPSWSVKVDGGVSQLERVFEFDDFQSAMAFSSKVGNLAESIGHHPRLVLEWGQVSVLWWTHKIGGLHKTDFIMAAKTDQLFD